MPTMSALDRAIILQVGLCYYCGCQMRPTKHGRRTDPTRDHRVPKRGGGAGMADNIVAACYACNHAKGILSAEIFVLTAWVERRKAWVAAGESPETEDCKPHALRDGWRAKMAEACAD